MVFVHICSRFGGLCLIALPKTAPAMMAEILQLLTGVSPYLSPHQRQLGNHEGGEPRFTSHCKKTTTNGSSHHLNGHLPIRQVLPSHPTGAEKIGSSFGDCNFSINYSEEHVFFYTAKKQTNRLVLIAFGNVSVTLREN